MPIRFHDFFCSLGYGLARIFSPLNYSPGIRKTHQHLSLPWRHLPNPPNSRKPRGPELIPGAVYDFPCPPAPQLATYFLALATAGLTRQYCPLEMLLWEESRGHKCQDLFLCAEPSHSKGLENRQCSKPPPYHSRVTLGQMLSSPGVGGGERAHSCFCCMSIEQKGKI